MDMLQNSAMQLSMSNRPEISEEFKEHLDKTCKNKKSEVYKFSHAAGFCIKHGLNGIIQAIYSRRPQALEKQAIELLARTQYYNLISPLVLAEQGPQDIATAISLRFNKTIPISVIQHVYYMFFQFGSMSEDQIKDWIMTHHSSKARHILLMALNEPVYKVKDALGIDAGLDLKTVSSRIMSRSLVKFEDLSQVNHFESMNYAMKWASIAMKAGESHEKVKGGEFTDFLSQFQISLQEADASIVRVRDSSEFDENEE